MVKDVIAPSATPPASEITPFWSIIEARAGNCAQLHAAFFCSAPSNLTNTMPLIVGWAGKSLVLGAVILDIVIQSDAASFRRSGIVPREAHDHTEIGCDHSIRKCGDLITSLQSLPGWKG